MRRMKTCVGFVRLEVLLALALLALVLQFFPSWWFGILWGLDVRNWPRTMWFAINWIVLLTMVGVRFGPDLYHDWRERKEQRTAERTRKQKQQELQEQRAMLDRLQQARSRRIY